MTVSEGFLVRRAKQGDTRALNELVKLYNGAFHSIASDFYAPGMTHEDLAQAARLGFLKAVRLFDRSRGMAFHNYAFQSIRMEVISAVKTATRGKHSTLNGAKTIDSLADGPRPIEPMSSMTPERVIASRETFRELCTAVDGDLTSTERSAVLGVAAGQSYDEIAVGGKAVDNALQRARRKLAPLVA